MRLAAIVDHRGRSATAIEMSVSFVDSENRVAGMKCAISRPARATILICSFLVSCVLQTIMPPPICTVYNNSKGRFFQLLAKLINS